MKKKKQRYEMDVALGIYQLLCYYWGDLSHMYNSIRNTMYIDMLLHESCQNFTLTEGLKILLGIEKIHIERSI